MQKWEAGLHICSGLRTVSKPFNNATECELRFDISGCHGVVSGDLRLIIPAEDAGDYQAGDEFSIRIRRL